MPVCETNGIRLAYQIMGRGEPLVLISGIGFGGGFWQWLAPRLAQHYQVILPSNRGTEDSDKPPGPYTTRQMAADIAGLLDVVEISSAICVGHSLGGFIAQELALSQPGLIRKLVLAATSFGGPNSILPSPDVLALFFNREGDVAEVARRGIAASTAPDFGFRKPERVQALIDYRLAHPFPIDMLQAQTLAGMTHDAESRLSQIQCPVLILCGEHDRVVPVGNADLMKEKIPQAEIEILPGVGHLFPIEDPELTAAALTQFLGTTTHPLSTPDSV